MLEHKIQHQILPTDTVLDLGCGIAQFTGNLNCKSILYADVWEPYLNQIKGSKMTIKIDIGNLGCFLDNSYDIVLCIDVIEHFEKEKALEIIREMDRIKIKKLIIFTTKGFVKQDDGKGWGVNNTEYQKHRCGFQPEELENLGFIVEDYIVPREPPAMFAVKNL
jgi:SAM-dependent methyltransferase